MPPAKHTTIDRLLLTFLGHSMSITMHAYLPRVDATILPKHGMPVCSSAVCVCVCVWVLLPYSVRQPMRTQSDPC